MTFLNLLRVPAVMTGGCLCLAAPSPALAHEGCATEKTPATNATLNVSTALPPLPPGVVDLNFREFFKNPVGPRGLEMTEKLRALDGQKVRLIGHMVGQCHPEPGRFMLAAVPVQLHEHEYGQADELPASAMLVLVPQAAKQVIPFTPGRLALTGTLSVGSREEPDGRVFHARLTLDAPEDGGAKDASATAPATPRE